MANRKTFHRMKFRFFDLKKLDGYDAAFILICSYLCNEINATNVYHFFEKNSNNPVEKSLIITRHMMVVRHNVLKIIEFERAYNKYMGQIKLSGANNKQNICKIHFKNVIKEINDNNFFRKIRNKMIAHYNLDYFEDIIENENIDCDVSFVFSDKIGETNFDFVNQIIDYHLYSNLNKENSESMDLIHSFTIKLGFDLISACHDFIITVLENSKIYCIRQDEFVSFKDIAQTTETCIPVIFDFKTDKV